jgi:vacuolar-type H+-ATPase subunit H
MAICFVIACGNKKVSEKVSPVQTTTEGNSEKTDADKIGQSSENWDDVLKSYETFIDKYISLSKKAQKGDVSAMTEYVEYMEKATELADKMKDADDALTPSQSAKFLKLQTKLANAAVDIAGSASGAVKDAQKQADKAIKNAQEQADKAVKDAQKQADKMLKDYGF